MKILSILFMLNLLGFSGKPDTGPGVPLHEESSNRSFTFHDLMEKYETIDFTGYNKPSKQAYITAINGFLKLKKSGQIKKDILTIIDFSLSSNEKRLWIIDFNKDQVIYNNYVAHGRNSGNEFAKVFSNKPQSYMSSLGFYVTGNTYHGKHGLSLRLKGMEKGINDNALKRAIVMHSADYVSPNFIKKYGRLGRSYGCPSIPNEKDYPKVIQTLAEGSCLFIYHHREDYLLKSQLLKR